MATEVIMPKFGMAQEEATILRWYKGEGERVEKGEPLLEVQTDKVSMDVEAPADGVVLKVKYGPNQVVPVTVVIAYIGEPGEVIADEEALKPEEAQAVVGPSVGMGAVVTEPAPPQEGPTGKVRATPVARKLAQERGIDITLVKGTGPKGLIRTEDVEAYAAAAKAVPAAALEPGADETVPLVGVRRTIAKRMQSSWQRAPHITFTVTIDMTAAEAARVAWNARRLPHEAKLSVTGLLIKAVAGLLTRHKHLNASPGEGEIVLHRPVNIGMAVAMEDGLIVPVLKGADRLSLGEIARMSRELAERARAGQLTLDEVQGGTFTISNLGMFGVEQFTAIINPPESAILAVGTVKPEVIVVDGRVAIGQMMRVTLSVDHRVADGAVAGRFLADLKSALEQPTALFS